MVSAIFNRFDERKVEDFVSVKEAMSFLEAGSESGSIFEIGIYDADLFRILVPKVTAIGYSRDQAVSEIKEACGLIGTLGVYEY